MTPASVVYDAGALLAAEQGDRRMWRWHNRTLEMGSKPLVPAAVLAQAWRGGPQPMLSRLLKGCRVEDLDELGARAAGVVCGRSGTSDVVDASVVVIALRLRARCVTSDPADLDRLANAVGRRLATLRV